MTQHYISNSLVAKFMQKIQLKIDMDGSLSKDEFGAIMKEVIEEHRRFSKF